MYHCTYHLQCTSAVTICNAPVYLPFAVHQCTYHPQCTSVPIICNAPMQLPSAMNQAAMYQCAYHLQCISVPIICSAPVRLSSSVPQCTYLQCVCVSVYLPFAQRSSWLERWAGGGWSLVWRWRSGDLYRSWPHTAASGGAGWRSPHQRRSRAAVPSRWTCGQPQCPVSVEGKAGMWRAAEGSAVLSTHRNCLQTCVFWASFPCKRYRYANKLHITSFFLTWGHRITLSLLLPSPPPPHPNTDNQNEKNRRRQMYLAPPLSPPPPQHPQICIWTKNLLWINRKKITEKKKGEEKNTTIWQHRQLKHNSQRRSPRCDWWRFCVCPLPGHSGRAGGWSPQSPGATPEPLASRPQASHTAASCCLLPEASTSTPAPQPNGEIQNKNYGCAHRFQSCPLGMRRNSKQCIKSINFEFLLLVIWFGLAVRH